MIDIRNQAYKRMTDSILDFLLSHKSMHSDDLDPLNWYLENYYMNRRIYEQFNDKLKELGYEEEQ